MKTHLIQSNEEFGPEERRAELRECWLRNKGLFDDYTDFQGRPSLTDLLALFKPDAINILCNADIFFDAQFVEQIKAYFAYQSHYSDALVLSRYDVAEDGTAALWAHCDSSDTWIVFGSVPAMDIPWPLGTAGVDNRIPHELAMAGFNVINPSRTIRTFHLHRIAWRSYLQDPSGKARGGDKIFRVPPPYKMVHPCSL